MTIIKFHSQSGMQGHSDFRESGGNFLN